MKRKFLSTFFILICLCSVFSSLFSVSALGGLGSRDNGNGLGDFKFEINTGNNSTSTAQISEAQRYDNGNPIIGTDGKKVYKSIDQDYEQEKAWESIYTKYRTLINFAYGAMMLTCLAGLVVSIISLGASGGNPHKKQQSMMGILFAGLGIALLGSVGTWFMFAMNIL